jgi:hypothetical protein
MIVKTGIIAVILLACIGAVSANLVLNPSFERPHVTNPAGWDIYKDNTLFLDWDVQWANDGTAGTPNIPIANAEFQNVGAITVIAPDGDQYAELDTDWYGPSSSQNGEPANVVISQNLATPTGAKYHVSYWQRCREADECTLQFDWTGAPSMPTTGVTTAWTKFEFDLTASGNPTIISFTDKGVPDSIGVLIDNVIVEQTSPPPPAVPEFPTIALPVAMIVGMLGAVLFIQRSKEN